ncbi:MAG: 2-isopropylmalate synthase [Alcanivoracaceae bacterium]|nr:2-isopropylmalate synthase [Alcanivoracaceae bacterium]
MAFDHQKYRPFAPLNKTDRRWPGRIIEAAPDWCAVDLRDGNQALVKPMTVAQKKRLFQLLVDIGFKEIEVGFPAASQPDFDFVRALIEGDMIPADVTIQVLVQAREELIARTYESLEGVHRAVVHVYNSTSTVQRERVFRQDRAGIKAIAAQGAQWVKDYAARYPDTEWVFQYSPESFTGTEVDYAVEVIDAVTEVWRPDQGQPVIINLPATVEVSTPNVFADMVETVCDTMARREHVRISLHTHNDRGCAVAAAELGVMAGADRIEGTLMGNGERTGNMDLVTMAMNLYSQGVDPQLDFSQMKDIVETVQDVTDIQVHPRHPYAGDLVYAAFSGSHQDAIRKCLAVQQADEPWQVAYLPIDPADVGRRYEEVVRINSQSGKGGVVHVLERDYGITLPRWLQVSFAKVVQQAAEQQGGEVDSAAIHRLFEQHYLATPAGWQLRTYDLHRSDESVAAQISVGDGEQPVTLLVGNGEGAVSALVDALRRRYHSDISVHDFDEFSLGDVTDANAMACVRVTVAGEEVQAVALAADTTSATLQAVLNAVARAVDAVRWSA